MSIQDTPSVLPGRATRTVSADAADAYLETFALNGIDYLFNSPGTEYAPLWELFAADKDADRLPEANGIRYAACRHEEVAMHAGMAYGMLTGEPQVVALHVNVGTLHAAMSIHGAYRARIPMVILASHTDTHERQQSGGTPGSHYINFDAPGGFEDHLARYTKWVAHPESNDTAPAALARAFRIARTPPKGPVLVNLSRELLYETDLGEVTLAQEAPGTPPAPGTATLDALAAKLEAAKNPLIIAGRAGRDPTAVDRLVTLAERLQAPVMESPKWHHNFPSDHPLWLGNRAFGDHYLAMDVDLVLTIDSKRPWYPPVDAAPDAEILMISPDPTYPDTPYWNYPVDALVTGAAVPTIDGLLDRLAAYDGDRPVDWPAEHDSLKAHWADRVADGAGATPIDPFYLCGELDRLLPPDAVLIDETIVHQDIIANVIETADRRFLSGSKTLAGGIGSGLGLTFGAALAEPDRLPVLLTGDGAFNYNPVAAAFGAAQEHGQPFLAVIIDNEGYRSQQRSHLSHYPDGNAARNEQYPGSLIRPKPGYDDLVTAWEGYGETVEDPTDVPGAIEHGINAVESGKPALIDVLVTESPPQISPPSA